MTSEEYVERCGGVQNLLIKAYNDVYCLDTIVAYNESIQNAGKALPKCGNVALAHICELLKTDLGLSIWKLYYDTDRNSNTIRNLNRDLDINHHIDPAHLQLSREVKELKSALGKMRNKYLAHNGAEKTAVSIEISLLKRALEEIRGKYNSLCYSDIDKRVCPLTDSVLYRISFDISLGLGTMIAQNLVPSDMGDPSRALL